MVPGGSEAPSGTASGDIFSGRRGRVKGLGGGGCGGGGVRFGLPSTPVGVLTATLYPSLELALRREGDGGAVAFRVAAARRDPAGGGSVRAPTGRARSGRRGAGSLSNAGETRRGAGSRPGSGPSRGSRAACRGSGGSASVGRGAGRGRGFCGVSGARVVTGRAVGRRSSSLEPSGRRDPGGGRLEGRKQPDPWLTG